MSLAQVFLGKPPEKVVLFNGDQTSSLDFSAYDSYAQSQQKIFHDLSSTAISPYAIPPLSEVADDIRHRKDKSQVASYVAALSSNQDAVACQASLNLIARLMLMVEVGSLEKAFGFLHQTGHYPRPEWMTNDLHGLASNLFPARPQIDCSGMSLASNMDAWSLENVAGIKIEFTDNLVDHLRLANNDTLLYIFHHAAFMEHQRLSSHTRNALLPDGLATETLQTLAILFPQSDHCNPLRSTRKKRLWFGRLCANSNRIIDRRLTWCGTPNMDDRQLGKFIFWRDRLAIIKEVFDQSTPDSFSQWWHDRRNGVQWHNFWVAIVVLGLTAFFGMIQCILAAVQVYKA